MKWIGWLLAPIFLFLNISSRRSQDREYQAEQKRIDGLVAEQSAKVSQVFTSAAKKVGNFDQNLKKSTTGLQQTRQQLQNLKSNLAAVTARIAELEQQVSAKREMISDLERATSRSSAGTKATQARITRTNRDIQILKEHMKDVMNTPPES